MLTVLRGAWRKWLRFAEIVGNVQMIIILSLVYWTIVLFLAVPFKFLADSLALRTRGRAGWAERPPNLQILQMVAQQSVERILLVSLNGLSEWSHI